MCRGRLVTGRRKTQTWQPLVLRRWVENEQGGLLAVR
jgi:hypothetical protein